MAKKKERVDYCAVVKRNGEPCQLAAGFGTQHVGIGPCRYHGGNTPQSNAKYRRDLEGQRAVTAVKTYGLPVDIDPHAALEDELRRTYGAVLWLEGVIGDLDEEQVTHLIAVNDPEPGRKLIVIDERPNVYIELYQRERKHYVAVAQACINAGIDQRKMEMIEEAAAQIAGTIRGVLLELGTQITPEVAAIVRKHLLAASAAPVIEGTGRVLGRS